jgi:hypothetical protein
MPVKPYSKMHDPVFDQDFQWEQHVKGRECSIIYVSKNNLKFQPKLQIIIEAVLTVLFVSKKHFK